jgi:hypothetical protein
MKFELGALDGAVVVLSKRRTSGRGGQKLLEGNDAVLVGVASPDARRTAGEPQSSALADMGLEAVGALPPPRKWGRRWRYGPAASREPAISTTFLDIALPSRVGSGGYPPLHMPWERRTRSVGSGNHQVEKARHLGLPDRRSAASRWKSGTSPARASSVLRPSGALAGSKGPSRQSLSTWSGY